MFLPNIQAFIENQNNEKIAVFSLILIFSQFKRK